MAPFDIKNGTHANILQNLYAPRPIDARNGASELSRLQEVDSATLYLLKKASRIPSIASCIIEGLNAKALAEVGLATKNVVLSSMLSPYFQSVMNILQSVSDFEGVDPHETCTQQDNECPRQRSISDVSDFLSCEPACEGGLVFQSTDFNEEENSERLDYVITQFDISRMARTTSRHLDVESINKLPIMIYHAKKGSSICSSHEEDGEEEEDVEDFLLRNAQIIEDYFDNAGATNDNIKPQKQEDPMFSWMVVPDDPEEDEVIRMPLPILRDVPDTISICKSSDSVSTEEEEECNLNLDDGTYDHCVICEAPFEDGDCLRVLPKCQHLLHCGCIDKWLLEEKPNEICITSGCPVCKTTQIMKAESNDDNLNAVTMNSLLTARLGTTGY